jgi:FdhD protein
LPTHLEELARGHLISEGICHFSDIKGVEVKRDRDDFAIAVTVNKCNPVRMERVGSGARVTTAEIWDAMKKLDESSVLFRKTGGTQVAGIDSQQNRIFVEDVSRHCAIDKVIGLAFDNDVDIANSALITSCRQTESTVKKAIHAQIPIVISTSAPTSLALEVAKNFGITLIGFARGCRFNIYSHEWRVTEGEC